MRKIRNRRWMIYLCICICAMWSAAQIGCGPAQEDLPSDDDNDNNDADDDDNNDDNDDNDDASGDADGDSDSDTDGDSDADSDGDADGDTDSDTDSDTDGDSDADTDSDTDGDSDTDVDADGDPVDACLIEGEPNNNHPQQQGTVRIMNNSYTFNPDEVETVRPDLFQPGWFSIFDILAHLDKTGEIEMEYHFDEAKDTHVIDDLEGRNDWWYNVYYDNGWKERSIQRMDYYPVKDGMWIRFVPDDQVEGRQGLLPVNLDTWYGVYEKEVQRRKSNGGKVIIEDIRIVGPNGMYLQFSDVEIKPYHFRKDMWKKGVYTTSDVIMTLGERGDLDCRFFFNKQSGGEQAIINNYWMNMIDDFEHYDRCGFVHETGEPEQESNNLPYDHEQGNHPHIPQDARLMYAPKYALYQWICI